ncbi:hypothetical protein Dsin_005421 [Dipteronia sinensis]|uniref:J domain-containing protein n=1 Tax=Dipteronia sinensis TaxID=43782 RepID=A0AAE0AXV5_9ROSI|nr:hypothetical protein Dsin_005421 [Dipteronia sinensis]
MIHPNGECNWYKVLGIEQHSVSCQDITHQFMKLAKMIDPEVHSLSAAPRSLKHITMAWENLGEPDKRSAYHARVCLPPPILESCNWRSRWRLLPRKEADWRHCWKLLHRKDAESS